MSNNLDELKIKRSNAQQKGNTIEEVEVLRGILEKTKEVFGLDSDETIKALNELGGTLKYLGFYDEALLNLNEAKDIIKKRYSDNNIAYATCLLNIAEVHRFQENFDLIDQIYLDVVKIYQKNNMTKTHSYAGVLNNLGLYYQNINLYEKALPLHEECLEILKNLNNKDYNLEYGVTLSNMVMPLKILGENEEALKSLEMAMDIFEKEVGKDHHLYSASLNNLAIHYFQIGDNKKALEIFEECLAICEKSFGKESDNYKNILSNIEFLKESIGGN